MLRIERILCGKYRKSQLTTKALEEQKQTDDNKLLIQRVDIELL